MTPLSIQLELEPPAPERQLAALAAQGSQTGALRAAAGEDHYRQVVPRERFGRLVPAAVVVTDE